MSRSSGDLIVCFLEIDLPVWVEQWLDSLELELGSKKGGFRKNHQMGRGMKDFNLFVGEFWEIISKNKWLKVFYYHNIGWLRHRKLFFSTEEKTIKVVKERDNFVFPDFQYPDSWVITIPITDWLHSTSFLLPQTNGMFYKNYDKEQEWLRVSSKDTSESIWFIAKLSNLSACALCPAFFRVFSFKSSWNFRCFLITSLAFSLLIAHSQPPVKATKIDFQDVV